MWIPFKDILATIETAIVHRKSEVYAELDEILTKHRALFINLLKNPGKNTNQREQVKKSATVGLKLNEESNSITFKESTIQDVLLLSDALNLNEFLCVELILAAELQSPNFPGISDPAICALLYHDGRRSILAALKLLLTARPGVTWTLELDERILELVTKFTENIISNGIVSVILNLLKDLSLPQELKKLEDAHALSDGKHKNMITELISEQQILLGDCLFATACQHPLDKSDCEKLVNHLKLIAPNTADGSLDAVTLRVLFSLLANFNCDILDLAVENIEDTQYQQLPYFKDKNYFASMHKSLLRPDDNLWQTSGIKDTIKFCWSIFLRTCSTHPDLSDFEETFEDDEEVINSVVANGVFQFLRKSIHESSKFSSEEYFVKIMHSFITSLIVKFPMKIKDWRNSGDENARIVEAHLFEGMEPPRGLSHDFKDFMDLISSLYKKDRHGLQLNCEYWIPPEPLGGVFSPQPVRKLQQALDQKKLMLNKFVRLAGDILMQTLYVSYIEMLASLSNNEQAASYCFRLLSRNERTGNLSLSWDHFFNSLKQYYMSLRSTPDAADHRLHMHRHQEISPEELEGLESVLRLIKCVAENNESVRIAFCENQSWLPVASLLGLVCCSVPPRLKGLLLETLAAFAKSPEVAVSLWHSLEAAQVLQTVEANGPKSGIAVELLEIESRNEAYPQTLGFAKLVDVLTDIAVPATLGAGSRIPGFHPYLTFFTENVFLTFKTRAYQNTCEKWRVGSRVLKILLKILKEYNPQPDHFTERFVEVQGINLGKASKPSGFQIMLSFLNDTPVFRMLLSVIDDVAQQLEGFVINEELKSSLEEISGYCMAILEQVLEKQAIFLELSKHYMSSMIVSPLDELLLSVNPRTGRPDYLCIIARYMTYANIQASITLSVIRIMKMACEGLRVQKEIVDFLAQNQVHSRELLVGFAEHLEVPDPELDENVDEFKMDDNEEQSNENQDLVRQNIVQLLTNTLNQPSVNIAQFLLGFDTRQPLARTSLQDPGVRGFPKTCLHSIITILNRGVSAISGPDARLLTPKLSVSLYRLMYQLCAHQEIGGAVRRYLRTNTDFYMKHIQALPFLPTDGTELGLDEIQYIRLANQQSWFLKTVAIDLRVVATSRMRSALQQLLGAFYSEQVAPDLLQGGADVTQRTLEATQMTVGDSLSRTMLGSAFRFGSDDKSLILSLLSSVSFTQRYPPNIELQFFDYGAVEQIITSCEELDEMGTPLCDVRKLYKVLMGEINNSQLVVGASQKQEILKEVKGVLKHAVDRNLVRESFHSKRNAFDAWRQVVEITFAVCPADMIPVEKKQSILMEILNQLVPRITDEDALSELSSAVAGTVLSLMANFWFTCTQIDSMKNPSEISVISMETVCTIFPGLVEGIIAVGSGQARTRANLYGAFLYYIQIGQMYNSITKEGEDEGGIFGKQSKESWETKTMQTLYKNGDSFFDIVAKDMCQGTCIARMMAMSTMDAIASLDWKHKYLMLMTSRGYLRVLVDQLLEEDAELQGVLSLQPQSMKPLYLFESKMSFLAKVASTDYGAQTLLQFGLISRLTECQFLDFHVEKPTLLSNNNTTMGFSHAEDPFLPSLLERYSKIFSSFARLILAFLSSVGIQHLVAISQIQNLVMNHEDLFNTILNDSGESHSMTSLKQLSLAIAIVSLLPITDKRDDAWEILTEEQRGWRSFMNRIHRLMLSLLNKYSITACKKIMNQTLQAENLDNSMITSSSTNQMSVAALETQNALLQIRSRVLTFCKNVISSQGLSGPYARVLFAPSFTDNPGQETRLVTGKPVSKKQLPNLSLIVGDLKCCPSQLSKCLEHMKVLDRKIDSLQDLPSDELREIISQESESERLPFHQRQVVALRILRKLKDLRQNEANLLSYIIENSVYILWRHIDYYYLHCVPTDDSFMVSDTSRSNHSRARHLNATDSTFSSPLRATTTTLSANQSRLDQTLSSAVDKDEINDLKAETPKFLTDKLWLSILEADKVHVSSRSRLSFLSSLVRRLQSIIKLNS